MNGNPLTNYLHTDNVRPVPVGRRIRRARFVLRYGWFLAIVLTAVVVVAVIVYTNHQVDQVMRAVLP